MERQIINPESEDAWLELRKPDITSTMMPALFNMSPHSTPFELYHAKKNGVVLDFEVTERMNKGRRMQGYALNEIALDSGWQVEPMNEYIRIPHLRMGSSFDGKAIDPNRPGKGIIEVKAVDFFQHKQKWQDEDGEFTEDGIPAHIVIQAHHQMEVAGEYDWCAVAVFTGIYDYNLHIIERDHDFGAALVTANNHFWNDVANSNEPAPNFYRDDEVISALYKPTMPGKSFSGDPAFDAVASEFKRWQAAKSEAEKEYKAKKSELHRMIENHEEAFGDIFKVKAGMVSGKSGTVVTEDMIGLTIGASNGYRQCLVTDMTAPKKSKK